MPKHFIHYKLHPVDISFLLMGGLMPSQLPGSLALPLTEPASADSIDWLACSWSNEHRLSLSQHPHYPFPRRNRGLVSLAGTEHFAARPPYDITFYWQNYLLSLLLWVINYSKYRWRRETLRIFNKPSWHSEAFCTSLLASISDRTI